MVVLIGMALLGGALIQMSGKADAIGLGGRKLRDGRPVMAQERATGVAMAVARDARPYRMGGAAVSSRPPYRRGRRSRSR